MASDDPLSNEQLLIHVHKISMELTAIRFWLAEVIGQTLTEDELKAYLEGEMPPMMKDYTTILLKELRAMREKP